MIRICLFFILLSSFLTNVAYCSETFYVRDKFQLARPGDYIVTAHDNAYSLLRLRSITSDVLTLEEVSVPSVQVNQKKSIGAHGFPKKHPDIRHGLSMKSISSMAKSSNASHAVKMDGSF